MKGKSQMHSHSTGYSVINKHRHFTANISTKCSFKHARSIMTDYFRKKKTPANEVFFAIFSLHHLCVLICIGCNSSV